MTMKQFETATRRGVPAIASAVPIEFEYETTEGEYVKMIATPPTTGQLALFLASQGNTGGQSLRAMFEFLEAILRDEDYAVIERQLRTGLDVQVVVDIVQWLTGEWAARPTGSPSASPTSRSSTGPRSTGRPRAAASTISR